MFLPRLNVLFCLLWACDSTAPSSEDASLDSGGHAEPAPLPADLIAACPESAHFERSGRGACTQIGCVNGYNLDVSPDSGWPAGAYRFELTLDGRAVTCQGSLPLKACGERSFSCDADGVSLGESGCALPAGQQGIANIRLPGYPHALSVRVRKDADELASAELSPTYTAAQPNGPGCEPICCGASGKLVITNL